MTKQRVSNEELDFYSGFYRNGTGIEQAIHKLIADLRDARAELARLSAERDDALRTMHNLYTGLCAALELPPDTATDRDILAAVSGARADTERLDYLDSLNEGLNSYHGTRYGWQVRRNHNRVQLSDSGVPAKTIRQAIDDYRKDPEWGK
jgi:hypothetical protein